MKELVALGAVTVERRRNGRVNLTNRYHLRASDPNGPEPGSRSRAAIPTRRTAVAAALQAPDLQEQHPPST